MKRSRFCLAENCDYIYDFFEMNSMHGGDIVLCYCRNMIDKQSAIDD